MKKPLIFLGKSFSKTSKTLGFGHGSTWPGHIALNVNNNFIKEALSDSKIKTVLVSGTNGKTTTAKMIETILKKNGFRVFRNESGANLLNGIASAIIINSTILGKLQYDYAIFEIDENNLPLFVSTFEPDFIVALNLFRDQLDRYGEIDSIAKRWKSSYGILQKTKFILNADDPLIAYLGENFKSNSYYFGLEEAEKSHKIHEHASDTILCPRCSEKLEFKSYYFSHLGHWKCSNCGLSRPKLDLSKIDKYPLLGTYAKYDTLAAVLTANIIGISTKRVLESLEGFKPAFGRQETIEYKNKKLKVFLSKNPTSFNESLRTIEFESPKALLIALNDRIPDGKDVSWIWDIDFETLVNKKISIYITGDRVYDLALRLKYAHIEVGKENIQENFSQLLDKALSELKGNDILYILPTYSAMLDIRNVLTGKKIL